MNGSDPHAALLWSLVYAVEDGATLAWSVALAGVCDPVPAAWAGCADDKPMRELLGAIDHPAVRHPTNRFVYDRRSLCEGGCERQTDARGCPECVAVLRALVPALSLADVLRAVRERDAPAEGVSRA